MTGPGNGVGKLWAMNGLLTICLGLTGAWAWSIQNKVEAGEKERDGLKEIIFGLRNEVQLLNLQVDVGFKSLRCDLCRRDEKFDDYRDRHGERVLRSPCPPCP